MESTPGSDGLERDLERRLDTVARTEREAAEHQAAQLAARRQTLADVCRQAVQSGTRLSVRIGEVALTGVAIYSQADLLSLQTTYGIVEINLTAIDALHQSAGGGKGGRPLPHEAESFMARLSLLQLAGESVEIITRAAGWRGEGRVQVVARDHTVLVTSTGPTHVLIASIAAVIRRNAT